jgi:hypothetical protein
VPRLLLLSFLVSLLCGQVGVPARRPGEAVVDVEEAGVIRGQAWDPVADRPAARVMVSLFRPTRGSERVWPEPWVREPGEADEAIARVRSDSDGLFFFRGLEPGYYVVRPRGVLQSSGAAEAHLTTDEPEQDVRLRVELGGEIRGVVRDGGGEPLADITVHVVGLDVGDGLNAAYDHQATLHTRTDPEGRYSLAPLPTGTVWIQAAARSFGFSPSTAHEVRSGGVIDGVEIVVQDERVTLGTSSAGSGGVGIRIDFGSEGPKVRSTIEGMPAEAVGLRAGDLIVEVAGRLALFMPPSEFTARCRGPVGSEVVLIVRHEDGSVEELTLTRRAFPE